MRQCSLCNPLLIYLFLGLLMLNIADTQLVSVSDIISLALGLASVLLSIITIYVTRNQRAITSMFSKYRESYI
jgi:hypothetical protein